AIGQGRSPGEIPRVEVDRRRRRISHRRPRPSPGGRRARRSRLPGAMPGTSSVPHPRLPGPFVPVALPRRSVPRPASRLARAVVATYLSFLLILGLSALVGQAVFAACGRRQWSRLAPMALLWRLSAPRRIAGCLLVGLAYMAASYLVQGAFKESIEALLVLAFAIGLHQLARGELVPAPAPAPLRAAPLAVLAVGAV